MSVQFDQVSVLKKANVYFDGKCVSHTVVLADGTRKSVGVILPSTLNFGTAAPETMELLEGHRRVRLKGQDQWIERSEEHTSELQSLMRISYAVFCLKKKTAKTRVQDTKSHLSTSSTRGDTPHSTQHQ